MEITGIVAEISFILSEEIAADDGREIGAETLLLSRGLSLDSVGLLQLIAAVEDRFDIEFADEELSAEVFESVGSLAEAARRKMAALGS